MWRCAENNISTVSRGERWALSVCQAAGSGTTSELTATAMPTRAVALLTLVCAALAQEACDVTDTSASWFSQQISLPGCTEDFHDEDALLEHSCAAGDATAAEEMHQIVTGPTDLDSVKKNLEAQGIEIKESSLQMIPQNTIAVGDSEAETIIKLSDALEDHDDVQAVYSDFEIDDAILEKLNAG